MISAKVCVIGAGPGGATAALQLNKEGIDCVVIDKAVFPRDKVCGDGLSGKVLTCLKKIDPSVAERMKSAGFKLNSWGVSFVAPNRRVLEVGYRPDFDAGNNQHKEVPIGYVCKRMDFDHFLVEELKRCAHVTLYEGIAITEYTLEPDGYLVSDGNGFTVKADLLILANGAHSSFTKKVAGIQMEPAHYVAGLRAYYKNVEGLHPENFIELHFLKSLLPGYFWIFPLPNGQANVGVGMLSETVSRKKVNLKKELLRIVETDPVFKERFKHATLEGGIEGYGLPLGSKKRVLTGERYLLVGDAAFLIDPFTGEGIGNAMNSGRMAALQAARAIQAQDYSAAGLAAYDADIERVLGPELRLSTRIQKLVNYPRLFNLLINISARNKKVQELLSCMFYEVDLRKKLTKPSFYIGLLLNK
ncbi:NAD(P)/FAD-dependent oxidoreductase [Niabella beijingensis]|uniref:NAD(P)/FAD-dependent oxidoreductase n=1 Tax=Niabella beijingensis TaxID=2872700 RepID=UPI001CBB93C4|nr:geranylgeranyl reductase family protein [Niabella beijingensis]MBZ4189201.1 geranylgeranyl reductase family protein [Niabella beijingensis]